MRESKVKNILPFLLVTTLSSFLWGDTWDDVFKGIQATSEVMNLFSQFNLLRSEHAISSTQLDIVRGQTYSLRQDNWNQWNGLVSLLTQEQKQMILKFNTLSDKDLARLWMIARKSTETFPTEWLMPTKYDSLSTYLYTYWTTSANPDEYFDYVKSLIIDDRKSLWENTTKDMKQEYKSILKNKRKSLDIKTYADYALYRNFCSGFWLENDTQQNWKLYLKEKEKKLKKKH